MNNNINNNFTQDNQEKSLELELNHVLQHFLINYNLLSNIKDINMSEVSEVQKEILFITRFPPIVGGVATQEYWRARYLALKGFKVRVVTNTSEADTNYLAKNFDAADFSWLNFEDELSGGLLQTYYTETSYVDGKPRNRHDHIPMDKMSHSKLVGIALKIIEKYKSSIIFSGYLEPYGSAAKEVSSITGIPLNQYFAGSDIERLTKVPELAWQFRNVMSNCNVISTTWDRFSQLLSMDIDLKRLSPIPAPTHLPEELFTINGRKIYEKSNSNELIIGIYGKYNQNKCIEEVVQAIKILVNKGMKVKLLLLLGGEINPYLFRLIEQLELTKHIIMLDFIAPWKVPLFLRSCDVICLLEEGFGVKSHAPITPFEISKCGVCTVFSREMFKKIRLQGFEENLNCLVVENPRDVQNIALILEELINTNKYIEYGKKAMEIGAKIISTSSLSTYIERLQRIQIEKYKPNKEKNMLNQEVILTILCFYPLTMSYLKQSGTNALLNWIKQSSFKTSYLQIAESFSLYLQEKFLGLDTVLDEIILFEVARIKSILLAKNIDCEDLIYEYTRLNSFINPKTKLVPKLRYKPILIELNSDIDKVYSEIYHQKVKLSFGHTKKVVLITSNDFKPISIEIPDELASLIFNINTESDISHLYKEIDCPNEFSGFFKILEQNNIVYWTLPLVPQKV
ncbi:glycosyltransferase (plasmid) [Bacillus mycoides]|uniref:glycosyltransferase n=1 Tax=Bacillus mycoides TaxID=1405 RepID=UPI001C02B76E|nr:glycosyltransferase [Bacillus mycoides]QWG70552.1 glycosyltransferase [Bacillus mycoides]